MNTAAEQGPTDFQPIASTTAADRPAADKLSARRMLTKAQVAARLGCSERSLERLVKQGRFPASRRYGRAVVWFESAVEHVLGLAEQEQLQWHPVATHSEVSPSLAVQPTTPRMLSSIPEAHELESEVVQIAARKVRKATSNTRRQPLGASAQDLQALRLLVNTPTV